MFGKSPTYCVFSFSSSKDLNDSTVQDPAPTLAPAGTHTHISAERGQTSIIAQLPSLQSTVYLSVSIASCCAWRGNISSCFYQTEMEDSVWKKTGILVSHWERTAVTGSSVPNFLPSLPCSHFVPPKRPAGSWTTGSHSPLRQREEYQVGTAVLASLLSSPGEARSSPSAWCLPSTDTLCRVPGPWSPESPCGLTIPTPAGLSPSPTPPFLPLPL